MVGGVGCNVVGAVVVGRGGCAVVVAGGGGGGGGEGGGSGVSCGWDMLGCMDCVVFLVDR